MTGDASPMTIDLAREAPFRLAAAEVRPATREVVQGDRREVLEPRVMQVLVALARNGGEVVSRHDLIEACWAGRVVGEDAINRCIAAVRRLAQGLGGFDVETIPRVGYRLSTKAVAAAGASSEKLPKRWLVAAGVASAVAIVALLAWTLGPWRAASPGPPRIAVQPFVVLGGDAQLKLVADGLSDDISGALNQTHLGTIAPTRAAANDIRVGATLSQDGPNLRVRAYLLDSDAANTLWTHQFTGASADLAALRDEVSGTVTEAALIATEPYRQAGLKLDPEVLALYVKGAWAASQPDALKSGEDLAAFSAAAAKDPHFVAARAMQSQADVASAAQQADPATRARLLDQARSEAQAAIGDDAKAAEGAFLALYRYDRARNPTGLARMEDDLRDGVARAPQSALLQSQLCQLLTEVGRAREAVVDCQRALALRPMGTSLGPPYAHAFYVVGSVDLAREQLDRALRYHPDSLNLRTRRLEIAMFSEPPAAARARAHDDRLRPQDWQSPHVQLLELFLTARETHAAGDIKRFMDAIQPLSVAGLIPPRYFVLCAALLGQTDAAFQALNGPLADFERDGFLFEPATESLRRDPRFWAVAKRFGLTAYWRARNVWPDFCSDPRLPYDCRAVAASI